MKILDELFNLFKPIIDYLIQFGHFGLAIYTILETLIFFVPPIELIFIPLILANPSGWPLYTASVIIFTFFASAIGYAIGYKYGYPILIKMTNQEIVDKTEALFAKYGVLAVAVCAFTPIPYTIAVFMAGIAKMNFTKYMTAAMLGRIPRFIIVGYVTAIFGTMENNNLKWIIAGVGGGLVLIYFLFDNIKNILKSKKK